MRITHRVAPGECLSSIARQYGFADYRTIYGHPDNASFRKKRPNPNVIYPGDQLVIPDKAQKTLSRSTGAAHRFKLKASKVMLRVVLVDDDGNAYGGKKYRLNVDGRVFEGRTGSEGLVEQAIPANARGGELVLFINEGDGIEGYTFPLELGHLDPPEEVTGAQARLLNLGYDCGGISGSLDRATKAALLAFQEKNGLNATGVLDDATVGTLRQMHEE